MLRRSPLPSRDGECTPVNKHAESGLSPPLHFQTSAVGADCSFYILCTGAVENGEKSCEYQCTFIHVHDPFKNFMCRPLQALKRTYLVHISID